MQKILTRVLSVPFFYSMLMRAFVAKDKREFFEEFIGFTPNERVLDVGCGPANILKSLNVSIKYTGIDLNPKYISSATTQFGSFASFLNVDVDELASLSFEKFDKILILGTLHHLSDDQVDSLLYNSSRLLEDDGVILTHDPVRSIGQNRTSKKLMDLDRGKFIRFERQHLSLFDKYFNTTSEIRSNVMRFPYQIIYVHARKKTTL